MDFELDSPSGDMLSCGSLVLGGPLEFSDFGFTWTGNFGPGTYDLIKATSLPSGVLGNSASGTIDGLSGEPCRAGRRAGAQRRAGAIDFRPAGGGCSHVLPPTHGGGESVRPSVTTATANS